MRGLSFDRHAFDGRRVRAVSKETGLSFADFNFFHVQRREKLERRLPTPEWSLRDEWLRELIVVYLENRFYIRPNTSLTLGERCEVAKTAAERVAPVKRASLRKWLQQYTILAAARNKELSDEEVIAIYARMNDGQPTYDADFAREVITATTLQNLDIQIQNVDTDLVLTAKGHAAFVTAIVYLYYRMNYDSVTVAEYLKLKSPHVRQVLARLHATWDKHLRSKFEPKKSNETNTVEERPLDAIFE